MARVTGNGGVGGVEKEGAGEEARASDNKVVGNGGNNGGGGGISKTTVDARSKATAAGEGDAPEVSAHRRERGSDTDRKENLGVGGGGVGGGVGGGGVMFVQANDNANKNKLPAAAAAVGLLVDLDPRHPAFVAVATFVVILLSVWCGRKKFAKKKSTQHGNPTVGGVGVGSGVGAGYATHGHRTRSGGGRMGDTDIQPPSAVGKATTAVSAARQASLCEVLYDVHAGVVPAGGIDSKAVREYGLTTAGIRRQFKRIKLAREADNAARGRGSPGGHGTGYPRSPLRVRPITARHQPREPDAGTAGNKGSPPTPQSPARAPSKRSGGKRPLIVSPKKATTPVSPRKTPGKRGASTRPEPSPKSVGVSAKRAAGGGRSSSTPSAAQTQAQTVPTTPESPMVTRGKYSRAPSRLPDSPLSSPRRRSEQAAGGDKTRASPGSSTPAKRGAPSTLELARRDAKLKADAVANARASRLTGGVKTAVTRSKRAKP